MPACGCSCPGPVSVLCEPVRAGFRVGSAMVGHTHTLLPLFPLPGVAAGADANAGLWLFLPWAGFGFM